MSGGGITGGSEPFVVTHETHSAVVTLFGDRAVKVKKPVDLGFLDFSTRPRREAACRREVELNRRLAPDAYLGVWDVVGPDGVAAEHLVVMKRMPQDRRLATLVAAGQPVDEEIRCLAKLLASFHSRAIRSPAISAQGTRDALARRWTDSFDQTRPFRGGVLDAGVAVDIENLTLEFLAGRAALFDERIRDGRVVDGHGDALAEDIFCVSEGPQVLDCIEFDDTLRFVDGLDDVAFLAMDLEYLGAPDLGEGLLGWYAEYAADPAPMSLRHHYVAYRAFVRAKVACLRHAQGDGAAAADVARHAQLAADHLAQGRVALVLVGGTPATGKTTLAGALADRLGAVVLSSDHIRKELVGLSAGTPAAARYGEGIYTNAWTERTYAELIRRAGMLLARGETVILDASWTRESDRATAAKLAHELHAHLVPLRCQARDDVVMARLHQRERGASDADVTIAAQVAARAAAWPQAHTIRTDTEPARSLNDAISRIRPMPARQGNHRSDPAATRRQVWPAYDFD